MISMWYIIINLVLNIKGETSFQRHEMIIAILGWTIAILMAALPFIDNIYGRAGAWCWMTNTWVWRFGLWYIWDSVSFVGMLICIIIISYKLRVRLEENVGTTDGASFMREQAIDQDIKTMRAYPTVYFLMNLFPTINRIQNAASGTTEVEGYVFPLVLLQCIFGPFLGLAISVTFVMDDRTRSVLNVRSIQQAWTRKRNSYVIREYPYGEQIMLSDIDLEVCDPNHLQNPDGR